MNIEDISFGSITIDGERYDHDVVIFPSGVRKRKKWITKEKHGTSHKFTRGEMREYLDRIDSENIDLIIVGTGLYGRLGLLDEAKELLEEREIKAIELKTPEAAKRFEEGKEAKDRKIGIFHVTC